MTKRVGIVILAIAAFSAVAWLGWRQMFAEPETVAKGEADAAPVAAPKVAPVDAAPPPSTEARVDELEGVVEQLLPDGQWSALKVGDVVKRGTKVRTGEGASVKYELGGNKVTIGAESTLTVDLTEVTLATGGQLEAQVAKSEEDFTVKNEGSEAEVKSNDGEFAVVNTGAGVTVATKEGESRLRAKGKEVVVKKGKLSRTVADSAPSAPEDIPTSIFLKVDQKTRTTRRKQFAVRGQGTPGTIVTVNGQVVRVGADGSFEYIVALKEGANRVAVVSKDVLGRSKSATVAVKLDSKGPAIGGEVKWK